MTLLLSGKTEELFLILSFDSEVSKLVTQSNLHIIKYKTDEQSFLFPSQIICIYVAPLSTSNVINHFNNKKGPVYKYLFSFKIIHHVLLIQLLACACVEYIFIFVVKCGNFIQC